VFGGSYNMLPSDDGDFNYDGVPLNPNNFSQFNPSGGPSAYDTQYTPVPYQVGGEEQVFEGKPYAMLPSDDGSFNYGANNQANFEIANSMVGGLLENNIIRNPNQETQPYRGIYIDPRTVPEINEVQSNTVYPPTMPAGYEEGDDISLVTTTDKPYVDNVPIELPKLPNYSQKELNEMMENAIVVDLNNIFNKPSGMTMPPSLQEGGDEQGQIFYNALKEEALKDMAGTGYLGINDYPTPAPAVPLSNNKDYYRMRYGEAGFDPTEIEPLDIFNARAMDYGAEPTIFEPTPVVNNNLIDLVHSQSARINQQESANDIGILADKMAGGITGHYDSPPGSSAAIDAIVANHYLRGGGW